MTDSHKKTTLGERFTANRATLESYGFLLVVVVALLGGYYLYTNSLLIYSDKAEISAPLITLSVDHPNILKEILVKPGDEVVSNQSVARLDNEFVRTQTNGLVVTINKQIGTLFSPGTPIVTMINPQELRVVAHIPEDKGFSAIHVGQKVTFQVDAFGSRKFTGIVDEVAQSADQASVVFSISDKRAEKEFSIKIAFNVRDYPELLNGMSARVWITK